MHKLSTITNRTQPTEICMGKFRNKKEICHLLLRVDAPRRIPCTLILFLMHLPTLRFTVTILKLLTLQRNLQPICEM